MKRILPIRVCGAVFLLAAAVLAACAASDDVPGEATQPAVATGQAALAAGPPPGVPPGPLRPTTAATMRPNPAPPQPAGLDGRMASSSAGGGHGAGAGTGNGQSDRGRDKFNAMCARCHDEDAEGDGPHHTEILPPEANLTLIRNTEPMMLSIVQHGIPGTAMPAFSDVSRDVFEDIHHLIKGRPRSTNREWAYPWQVSEPRSVRDIGRALYVTACSGCHGETGSGKSHWGEDPHIWPKPANFHARSSEIGRLYYIISNGREGVMMAPQEDKFPPAARWALAEYVAGLFDEETDAR